MIGSVLGNIAGAVIGGVMGNRQTAAYNQQSAANTASANQMSRQIAREQMAFQEKMSNTLYQIVTGKQDRHVGRSS